jgi:hypothetical protein
MAKARLPSNADADSQAHLDSEESLKETNMPGSGEYTRLMGTDEYREWVRQTVSGQIWGRMAAIFSAVGFATILAMLTYISTVSNSTIEGKIATEIQKLDDGVEKKLPNIVNQELTDQIRKNELTDRISKEAVDQITKNKGVETALQKLIISQSQKILADREASQASLRAVALQQILLFGDEAEKSEAITSVLLDDNSGGYEFSLALQNYPSHQSNVDHRRLLDSILERAALRDANFGPESWSALEKILRDERELVEACGWLRHAAAPMDQKYSADSVRAIVEHIAKIGSFVAGELFAGWLESSERTLRELGQDGLSVIVLPRDQTKRHQLIKRITRALAGSGLPLDEFQNYLSQSVSAIQQKDRAALRGIADSDFASPKLKAFVTELLTDSEDRFIGDWATRHIHSNDDLLRFAKYGQYERHLAAYRFLATLLDIDPVSGDWDMLIKPEINEAGADWTKFSRANLLVNAWVLQLQANTSSHQESTDVAAELFVNSHIQKNYNLIADNTRSYRYLISRASEGIIDQFLGNAPNMIGAVKSEGDEIQEVDENEAAILSDVLARILRENVTVDRIKQIRDSFLTRAPGSNSNRSNRIWFAGILQDVKRERVSLDDVDYYQVLLALTDKFKKDNVKDNAEFRTAIALLSVASNKNFLQAPNILRAAERANLHFFADDLARSKSETLTSARSDPSTNELLKLIQDDVRSAIGWFGKLESLAAPITGSPVAINGPVQWLSFTAQQNEVARLEITPPAVARLTLVDSSNRVVKMQPAQPSKGASWAACHLHGNRKPRHSIRTA